jgi:hypothetical protein
VQPLERNSLHNPDPATTTDTVKQALVIHLYARGFTIYPGKIPGLDTFTGC